MKYIHVVLITLTLMLTACASTPNYKPPASENKSAKDYQREQIPSQKSYATGRAALGGIVGGLLGPLGAIITGINSGLTVKDATERYFRFIDNSEIVGVVTEDITVQRSKEYLANPRWFYPKLAKSDIPPHYSVDMGSGNQFYFPAETKLNVQVGDVVTIIVPATAHRLASVGVNFKTDMPRIVAVRCQQRNVACVNDKLNEPGIARRFAIGSDAFAVYATEKSLSPPVPSIQLSHQSDDHMQF